MADETSAQAKMGTCSDTKNVMFLDEEVVDSQEVVAAFKRASNREKLTMQQRIQNNIGKSYIPQIRRNPDFLIPSIKQKKTKKKVTKSKNKAIIEAPGQPLKEYDLISSLAQASAGKKFGHIARVDIDFAKEVLQKMLSGRKIRSSEKFANRDEVHGLSMSKHLLLRVKVYSEDILSLFNSGAMPKLMSKGMVNRLNIRIAPTRRRFKVANGDSEPCLGALTDVPVSMGELTISLDFLVIGKSPYDAIIGLPTMITLRACPDYNRMLLKIHFKVDSEILNYEYERENGNTSEDQFTSAQSDDTSDNDDVDEELVPTLHSPGPVTHASDEE